MFMAAIVHTLHSIWMSRNTLRFSNDKASIHVAQVKIDYFVTMSGNNSSGCCLVSDVPFLDSFSVSPHHRRRLKEVVTVFWKPPFPPWLKINTDGSVVGTNSACGGISKIIWTPFLGPSPIIWELTRCLIQNCWVISMLWNMQIWMGGKTSSWKVIQLVSYHCLRLILWFPFPFGIDRTMRVGLMFRLFPRIIIGKLIVVPTS